MSARERARVIRRLKRYLSERGGCTSFVKAVADLRLAPSELRDAIFELEAQGKVFFDGERVCLLSSYMPEVLESDVAKELIGVLKREGFEVVAPAPLASIDVVALPSRPLLVRGRRYSFAFKVIAGRVPPGRLTAAAREAAKASRRLAESWDEFMEGKVKPEVLIPVVVIKRGAFQFVEGVTVTPLDRLRDLVADPSPVLANPVARYYRVAGSAQT